MGAAFDCGADVAAYCPGFAGPASAETMSPASVAPLGETRAGNLSVLKYSGTENDAPSAEISLRSSPTRLNSALNRRCASGMAMLAGLVASEPATLVKDPICGPTSS